MVVVATVDGQTVVAQAVAATQAAVATLAAVAVAAGVTDGIKLDEKKKKLPKACTNDK